MAQVAIPPESKHKLDLYAKKHRLKIYEALTKLIDDNCSGLTIIDRKQTKPKKPKEEP